MNPLFFLPPFDFLNYLGALFIDSSEVSINGVSFYNNSALFNQYTDHSNQLNDTQAAKHILEHYNVTNTSNTTGASNSTDDEKSSSSKAGNPNKLDDQLEPRPLITVNLTGSGGAIAVTASVTGSVVRLRDSNVYNNTADNCGGGIFLLSTKLYIDSGLSETVAVVFNNNTASLGGNLYLESSTVVGKRSLANSGPPHFRVEHGSAEEFGRFLLMYIFVIFFFRIHEFMLNFHSILSKYRWWNGVCWKYVRYQLVFIHTQLRQIKRRGNIRRFMSNEWCLFHIQFQ